jgi:hypothetical protein
VCAFYKRIDVQVVWRNYPKKLANPLKLVNAAAFGVPTVALAEPYFEEMGDCYLSVKSLDGLLARLEELRAWPSLYEQFAARCLARAEDYHIDRVAELYKELT